MCHLSLTMIAFLLLSNRLHPPLLNEPHLLPRTSTENGKKLRIHLSFSFHLYQRVRPTLSLTSFPDFEPLDPLLAISPLWAVDSTNSRAHYSYTEHTAAAAPTREERSQGRLYLSSHSSRVFGSSSTVQPFPSTASIFYGSPLEVGIHGAPFVGKSRDESAELDAHSSAFDSYNDSRLDFTLGASPEFCDVRKSCSIRRQVHLFASKGIGSTEHSGRVSDKQPQYHSLSYEGFSQSEPLDDDSLGGLGDGDWSFCLRVRRRGCYNLPRGVFLEPFVGGGWQMFVLAGFWVIPASSTVLINLQSINP